MFDADEIAVGLRVDTATLRRSYIDALRAADAGSYAPLLCFARGEQL